MKVKHLIQILETMYPDDPVMFQLGSDDKYRERCAKAELVTKSSPLETLVIDKIEITCDDEPDALYPGIILKISNEYEWIDEKVKEFDKKFGMRQE